MGFKKDRVSIYVERAFTGSAKPSADETSRYSNEVVRELQDWGFIEDVEVADPTWIDVAYTWSRPDSDWKQSMKHQTITFLIVAAACGCAIPVSAGERPNIRYANVQHIGMERR